MSATKPYQPNEFESKMMDLWEKEQTYILKHTHDSKNTKGKMYCLSMFPYPSGAGLHVGHVRIYTGTDVLARYFRMQGYDVLHPMGWDAFGLPAENAAIKAKKNPMEMVPGNISNFKRQMQMLGLSYDWKREFSTTDPSYYRWTQWLFIQFFRMGLLYKKNTPIHFCPKCKTGLAEEEVLSNGTHERCGSVIEKKELPQWIFRITTYAERLLQDLNSLDWPKGILEMQKNWIGKKEGINISYKVVTTGGENGVSPKRSYQDSEYTITCFTTRPDTNFGATFIVVAPEHEFVKKIISKKSAISAQKIQEITEYVEKAKNKTEMERESEGRKKTGVFTGYYAVNNLNGRLLPIWISDFVLGGFGTGAVVGVPGHDRRDFEFAKQFDIPIIRVVVGKDGNTSDISDIKHVQEEEGTMINSDFLNGMDIHAATTIIMDHLEKKGWGKRVVTYHLRDWIFSRQRYWGEPIPMVYCKNCASKENENYNPKCNIDPEVRKANKGWIPISEDKLPLELPYVQSYEPTDTGESPLTQIETFVKTTCPLCGKEAQRETDTMPNWAGSCWYFLAFAHPEILSSQDFAIQSRLLPVDWYLGGAEHAVLHLLYSRFWIKALQDLGLVHFSEPFLRLRNVGMVLAQDHRKMSKSFGNVINPDDVVKEYGADTLRIYEMFMAPFNMEIAWSTEALQGAYRFLKRVWNIFIDQRKENKKQESDKQLQAKLYKTIKKVGEDINQTKFNTAIAAMMEFLNAYEGKSKNRRDNILLSQDDVKKFLQILAPFAPFISEYIWREILDEKQSIHLSKWPEVDVSQIKETVVKIPVQINGKLRGLIEVTNEDDQQSIETKASQQLEIAKYLNKKKYKVIYVKGRIVSFVLL